VIIVKIVNFRGFLALAVLKELEKGPIHGYALMSRFREEYGLRPSPGAVYIVLKKLTDLGFIRVEKRVESGRRVKLYSITEEGRRFLSERAELVRRLERFSTNLKLAKSMGFVDLARNMLWLLRHIHEIPREKLEELRGEVVSLSEKIEKLREVVEWKPLL